LQTISPHWLWTSILLISASWVARIIGMSHQRLASYSFNSKKNIMESWVYKNLKFELVEWLKWYIACLARVRPWVQIPVPQKKKFEVSWVIFFRTTALSVRSWSLHSRPLGMGFLEFQNISDSCSGLTYSVTHVATEWWLLTCGQTLHLRWRTVLQMGRATVSIAFSWTKKRLIFNLT
jgi:hypothetical protein